MWTHATIVFLSSSQRSAIVPGNGAALCSAPQPTRPCRPAHAADSRRRYITHVVTLGAELVQDLLFRASVSRNAANSAGDTGLRSTAKLFARRPSRGLRARDENGRQSRLPGSRFADQDEAVRSRRHQQVRHQELERSIGLQQGQSLLRAAGLHRLPPRMVQAVAEEAPHNRDVVHHQGTPARRLGFGVGMFPPPPCRSRRPAAARVSRWCLPQAHSRSARHRQTEQQSHPPSRGQGQCHGPSACW